ncbi:MAG: FAD-dependent oxidoreductase [Acidimicrobiia bacterium]
MAEQAALTGPELRHEGVPVKSVAEGEMVLGHADDKPVVLARTGGDVFAVSGRCTHYGGPVGEGLFDGELLRCPWHHACFDLRTGRAVRAPALNALPCFAVEEREGRLYVGEPIESKWTPPPIDNRPDAVVVIGAGAAAAAAVETLRDEGYRGPVTMISDEETVPTDRPNLSKDYLAGAAPEEWMPLRSETFYEEHSIDLRLGTRVTYIDAAGRSVRLDDGSMMRYGALLLATGADPIRLDLPGGDLPHVHYLRTLADSRAIIAGAKEATSAVVLGASFIGLEVAASLHQREIAVHVVAPEHVLMEPVLGREVGEFIQSLHQKKGVRFHLGHTAKSIGDTNVVLDSGAEVPADLVVIGVGVRPNIGLADAAGLEVDNGVVVDEYLRTSDPAIWAAGDIARYPDRRLDHHIRVEHWVVAERQGQAAARNILGRGTPFTEVPFFWSEHYDVRINYVGHTEDWDTLDMSGHIADRDATIGYREGQRIMAVASINRDKDNLDAELAMEQDDEHTLRRLIGE